MFVLFWTLLFAIIKVNTTTAGSIYNVTKTHLYLIKNFYADMVVDVLDLNEVVLLLLTSKVATFCLHFNEIKYSARKYISIKNIR